MQLSMFCYSPIDSNHVTHRNNVPFIPCTSTYGT